MSDQIFVLEITPPETVSNSPGFLPPLFSMTSSDLTWSFCLTKICAFFGFYATTQRAHAVCSRGLSFRRAVIQVVWSALYVHFLR